MSIVTTHVGLDYHDETVRTCVLAEDGKMLFNRDLANDPQIVAFEVMRFGPPRGVVIEACCGAADFAAELREQTGWRVRLAHPGYVKRLKQGPDKTDHGDAWLLADLDRVGYVPVVWLADETTRQLRRLVCYREGLKKERKNVKLRIRSLLREERIPAPAARPWTKAWRDWLRSAELGPESRWVMDRLIDQFERLQADLRGVEMRMQEATADDALTQRLLEEKGVGLITAVALRAEVGRFDRFGTGKQLARFCGVTPCNVSSGKRQADAGLIKAGSRELRALLIETAKRLPRCDPHFKEMKERLRRTKPANVVTCAIANRWLRGLFHRMLTVEGEVNSQTAA
jgi:transposase